MYNTPHGLANALLLPKVLHLLKSDCQERLTQLAVLVGLNSADQFIEAIESLNKRLSIPQTFPELKREDITLLTKRALKEAHGTYPVPSYLTQTQGEQLLEKFVDGS
jgi:alcohol dehydrogenase class IV